MTPAACALRREIHTHTDAWTNLEHLRILHDQAKFGEIFDHWNNATTKFRGEHREFDVALFLEAVADDQTIGRVTRQSHDCEKLGL